MNYLAEINAFERWLEVNYLPNLSQLLWYKLIMLNNRAGWVEWVQVDNLRLMALTQIESKSTLVRTRDKLVEAGLVSFKKGRKGFPNCYKLYSFCGSKNEPQMTPQTDLEMTPQMTPQTDLEMTPQMTPQTDRKRHPKQASNINININKEEKDILTNIQKEPEWAGYVSMRKKIKKPMTDRAIQMALNKLEDLAPEDIKMQKKILDQSTYHCWQGLFALKENEDGITCGTIAKGSTGQNAGEFEKYGDYV